MATLTLNKLWLNRLDTGEAISAWTGDGRPQLHDMDGKVRTYGGGRQRSVATEGERGQFAFTLRDVSLATVTQLRAWKNLPIQARDHRGQRFFGVYYAVAPIEAKDPALYDVSITLRVVSVDEGV
jgi:hypothetical protein